MSKTQEPSQLHPKEEEKDGLKTANEEKELCNTTKLNPSIQNDKTKNTMEKTADHPPKKKLITTHIKFGRKGDPRMNKAVVTRLDNPKISLVDALLIGGFSFPKGINRSDRHVYDSDDVSLIQRKNQLLRRLRILRKAEPAKRHVQNSVSPYFPNNITPMLGRPSNIMISNQDRMQLLRNQQQKVKYDETCAALFASINTRKKLFYQEMALQQHLSLLSTFTSTAIESRSSSFPVRYIPNQRLIPITNNDSHHYTPQQSHPVTNLSNH